MYNIRFLLVLEDWQVRNIAINEPNATLVYASVVRVIKQRTGMMDLDFLPLGNEEYLIWGQGRCQGYMSIKAVGPEILVPDSEGGQ